MDVNDPSLGLCADIVTRSARHLTEGPSIGTSEGTMTSVKLGSEGLGGCVMNEDDKVRSWEVDLRDNHELGWPPSDHRVSAILQGGPLHWAGMSCAP